jgi:hypothetical protein
VSVLSFLRSKPKPEETAAPHSFLGIYQIHLGDVIMTRPLLDLILTSMEELPTMDPEAQKLAIDRIVRNIKLAIGQTDAP